MPIPGTRLGNLPLIVVREVQVEVVSGRQGKTLHNYRRWRQNVQGATFLARFYWIFLPLTVPARGPNTVAHLARVTAADHALNNA